MAKDKPLAAREFLRVTEFGGGSSCCAQNHKKGAARSFVFYVIDVISTKTCAPGRLIGRDKFDAVAERVVNMTSADTRDFMGLGDRHPCGT